MPIFTRKKIILVFLIVCILVSFGLGFLAGKFSVVCKICPPEEIDFSLFWEVWKILGERFYEPQKIDIQKMIYGAISGMVKSLGDPYTVFFNPEEAKKFTEEIKGAFEGIGAEIGIKKGQLLIIAPLEGTPAKAAGLLPGDKILKIDERDTEDLTVDEAVSLIRGPKGTEVSLTIFREGWEKQKEIKIVRAVIKIPSIDWELKSTPEGEKVAYLKLYQFFETASLDFRKVAIEILNSPAKKIILDLRNNSGGLLNVAEDIAGWFLKRGEIIVIVEGKEREVDRADGNEGLFDYPIVVLINRGTASGAEILAAALRDNRGIKLIGETSFGKGLVQEAEELGDGSLLKITIAKWLTPKGQLITDLGLEPDIKVEMTEKDYEEGKDPQLEKAIEVIEKLK